MPQTSMDKPAATEPRSEAGPATPLRLDEPAPAFEGRSTHGTVKLADYRGRWLVFFAHPADFTPVCASELVVFARRAGEFTALNCALLGGWKPGDRMIEPPPDNVADAVMNRDAAYGCVDWYYWTRSAGGT